MTKILRRNQWILPTLLTVGVSFDVYDLYLPLMILAIIISNKFAMNSSLFSNSIRSDS